jgi:hypothetical protein
VESKSRTVIEMYALGWGGGGGVWVWRRQLRVREEDMLGECQVFLHDFSLWDQVPDTWQWQLDHVRGYSVSGAY